MEPQNEPDRDAREQYYELEEIDREILDAVEAIGVTRKHIYDAADVDVQPPAVSRRLDELVDAGLIEKHHDGFYGPTSAEVNPDGSP